MLADLRVRRWSTGWALMLVAVFAALAAPADAGPDQARPHQESEECSTVDTTVHSVTEATSDDGATRKLRTLMLLDGVTRQRAEEVVAEAVDAYAPLGIALTARYRSVKPTLDPDDRDPLAFIEEAKRLVGGRRPNGIDVVYLITTRDMAGKGYADCIGGVAFSTHAFAVGEADSGPPNITAENPVPVWPWGDGTALTFAHELGHLLGGQHQLANCVEGLAAPADLPSPCTVMDPSVSLAMRFSTANAAVVRGHAVAYLQEMS